MDHQRSASLRVYQLDAQWELPAVVCEGLLADYAVEIHVHNFAEGIAGEPAVEDLRVPVSEVCDLVALGHGAALLQLAQAALAVAGHERLAIVFLKVPAAPGEGFADGQELEGI